MVGRLAQAVLEPIERAEVELAIAPLQHADRIEGVVLQPVDQIGLERSDLTGHAERSVIHVTPGAAGDLAKLGGVRLRWFCPSNLRMPAKATWSRSRLSPMPIASVATRKSTSPFW